METTRQALPLRLLNEALGLAARFRDVEGLQRYLAKRRPLVLAASAAMLVSGLACAAGVFMFLAESSAWLALPALILAPFVALGSLFVQFYVFFSWLEGRALARALGHRAGPPPGALGAWLARKLRVDLGSPPPVPWPAAAILVVLPLAMLAVVAPLLAAALLVAAVATPLLYARLDPTR